MSPAANRAHLYIDELETLERTAKVRPAPPLPQPRALVVASSPPVPTKAPRTDVELLDAILSAPERLTTSERKAFQGMRNRFGSVLPASLSYAQREWAQRVAARLGFEIDVPIY
jgi:hypothetical protein